MLTLTLFVVRQKNLALLSTALLGTVRDWSQEQSLHEVVEMPLFRPLFYNLKLIITSCILYDVSRSILCRVSACRGGAAAVS